MKILHINSTDYGGAATACLRIHRSLIDCGVDSKMLVLHKTKQEPEVYQYNYWGGEKSIFESYFKRRKLLKYLRNREKIFSSLSTNHVEFSFPETVYDVTRHPLYLDADIIQLNWVSGFLDEASFFRKNTKPVIWRMADLYVCGGGNHYEKNFPYDSLRQYVDSNYSLRRKILENVKIDLVPISCWTKKKALESELVKNYPMTVINNGIDINIFKKYDSQFSREVFNLPKDKYIILFGAASLSDPRKGISLLLEALTEIKQQKDILICSFGDGYIENDKVLNLGVIKNESLLSLLYSAVDLFIMSSIEETFGQVTLEALACGLPVVSFPNGGSLDMIEDGVNGLLAEKFDADSLEVVIKRAINTDFDRNRIREYTVQNFNIKDKAKEYIDLYLSVLSNDLK